jgi:hypothetical protein
MDPYALGGFVPPVARRIVPDAWRHGDVSLLRQCGLPPSPNQRGSVRSTVLIDGRSPQVTQSVLELVQFRGEGFIEDERI